jgi:membrane-associated protease RseP (regulator of RpoE activity)
MTRPLLGLLLTAASARAIPARFPLHPLAVELGLRVVETTGQLRKALDVKSDHGVLVTEVQAHGPADRAGLRAGDVVTRVAGEPIASATDVLDALDDRHPGDEIPIEYVRRGARATVQVKLARAEPPRMRVGQWSFPIPGGYSPGDAERELRRFRERVERQFHDLDERLRHLGERVQPDRTAL